MTEHHTPNTITAALKHMSEVTGKAPSEITWQDLERVAATADADQHDAQGRDASAEFDRRQEKDET